MMTRVGELSIPNPADWWEAMVAATVVVPVIEATSNPPGPIYPSLREAAQSTVDPDPLDYIGPTNRPDWVDAGHVEAWTGWFDDIEKWVTGFLNPESDMWGGEHDSSRNDLR
jgi:hypothetical protein